MRIGVSFEDRVGDAADTVADAARVFEIAGIDCCDKRERTLGDGAKAANFDPTELLQLLDPSASTPPFRAIKDPEHAPLHEVTRSIVSVHHKRARSMLVRATLIGGQAASAHADKKLGPDETIVVPRFGTVEHPQQGIRHDHTEDLVMLSAMPEASNDFIAPKGACDRIREPFSLLGEFDTDLQQDIRLENDVLFPRAIEAERSAAKRR